MKQFTYTVTDKLGIHARPAGDLVKVAKEYNSTIKISCNGKSGYVYKKYVSLSSGGSSGSSSSDGTCQIGDSGSAVKKVQKRLIALGYLSGNADGSF